VVRHIARHIILVERDYSGGRVHQVVGAAAVSGVMADEGVGLVSRAAVTAAVTRVEARLVESNRELGHQVGEVWAQSSQLLPPPSLCGNDLAKPSVAFSVLTQRTPSATTAVK
jgi:hypothetical protein